MERNSRPWVQLISWNVEYSMIFVKMAIGREIQPPSGAVFLQERIANCIKLAIILVDLIGRIQEGKAGGVIHISHDKSLISARVVHIDVQK